MLGCPERDRLADLLTDRLGAVDRETLESHLSDCTACQDSLLELAGGSPEWPTWRGLLPTGLTGPVEQAELAPWPTVPGYEILGELGRGGVGVVYKARHVALERVVALKVLREARQADPEFHRRFRREAEILARLQHPNLVQIHDLIEQGDSLFLVLEFVAGSSLAARLREATLPPAEAARLVETLARAMQQAHHAGIVHRDLKPANILMEGPEARVESRGPASSGPQPLTLDLRPKITDFGLARQLEAPGETRTGDVLGTPSYMAPEQARGEIGWSSPAADIYALGAILYEALTGRPPFRAESAFETIRQVAQEEPVPPSRLQPKLPRDLETICLKCLEKTRARRYPSCAELAEDLRRFQANEPILARRTPPWRRLAKWARRRPALATLSAAIAVMVLALLAVWFKFTADVTALNVDLSALNVDLEAQRNQANRSEDEAKAVLKFFQDRVLAAGRPEGQGLGRNISLREAVDAGEPQIAATFQDQPLVEVSIRNVLARTYLDLGEPGLALPQYERALALRRSILGSDHADTLQSMNYLAEAYRINGQLDKALPLFQETLAKRKARLGLDHDDTLISMNNLAAAYHAAGEFDKALPLYEEALAKQRATFGTDHEPTLISINNLALAYQAAGRLDKTLPLVEEVLAKQTARLGRDHPDTLRVINNLAVAYHVAGQHGQALPLFQETLATRRTKLGPDHRDTLISMNNLASAYEAASQFDKALPLYEETLAKRKATLGPDHAQTLNSMNNLARAHQAMGDFDKALPLFEETLSKRTATLGPDHPSTLKSLGNLAFAYRSVGRLDEALPLLEQTLAKQTAKLGSDHPDTLSSANNLALVYQDAGQLDQALLLLEETVAKRKTKLGRDHPDTLLSLDNLARAYVAVKRFLEAEELQRGLLEQRRTKISSLSDPEQIEAEMRSLADVHLELGHCLLSQKKYAEAEVILRESLASRQTRQPDSWVTFNTMSVLGAALLGQKKLAEAEPLLIEGYEGMKRREEKIPATGRVRMTEALQRLVDLYDAWGKKEEAEQWGKELESAKLY